MAQNHIQLYFHFTGAFQVMGPLPEHTDRASPGKKFISIPVLF